MIYFHQMLSVTYICAVQDFSLTILEYLQVATVRVAQIIIIKCLCREPEQAVNMASELEQLCYCTNSQLEYVLQTSNSLFATNSTKGKVR